ncbi:MAG TPA: acyltransferase [Candidatus Bathyarchaeia archaeon]|nr:acyltransferase [Candidatus Bathyarchaeia archaeon]
MSKNSANLDVLRAIAVLMVFCHHILEYGYFSERRVSGLGQFGVLIFFVHTSLVLMMSMERNSGALNFYIRRFFRIYPLSMLVVGLVTVMHIPSNPAREYASLGAFNLLSNLALTMNLTHSPMALAPLWSLPIEVQMYVLLPLLFLLTRTAHPFRNLMLVWAALVPLAWWQPLMNGPHNILRFAPCFVPGIIAYVLLGRWAPKLPWFCWPPVVLAAYAAYQLFDPHGTGWAECLALGLAVPFFKEVQVPMVRRAAAAIAKYSYGIYLFHLIAIYYCFDWMTGATWLRVACSLVFTAVAAVASYHLLEAPLIEYGRRLGHALAPPPSEKKAVAQAVGT